MQNNFAQVAARLRGCDVELVSKLVEKKLLPVDVNGNIRLDHVAQFVNSNALMSRLKGLRRELADEKEAKREVENRLQSEKADLLQRIELAKADADYRQASELLTELNALLTGE